MTPAASASRRRRARVLVAAGVGAAVTGLCATLVTAASGTASAGAPRVAAPPAAIASEPAVTTLPAAPWVGTWATAVAVPRLGEAAAGFGDTTLRQRIHVSIGGDVVRLHLTNVYGTSPLAVSATLARPGTLPGSHPGDIDPGTLVPVTFGGARDVVIPIGSELASDPVPMLVPDQGDLWVSLYVPGPTGPATYHPSAHTTGYVADGDQTETVSASAFPRRTGSFWFLDGLDVRSRAGGAVALLGDSITDGAGSTAGADRRWPDRLADRLLALRVPLQLGILNAGIGGNRVLLDAYGAGQGDRALDRLTRDVLTQTGVETVVVAEGVNDIQQQPSENDPQDLVDGYRQILARAHQRGLRVVVGTITPFDGWRTWTPEREAVRVAVNHWIRTSGEPDAVLDLDAVLRDPGARTHLRAAYDSGDHLHPNDDGYAAMAASVDLRDLRNPRH